jgi:hypothetical protein
MNANEQVVGDRCILVPYCKHHVAKYHLWMQNSDLLKQTSSEPLTLAEELAMQTSWRNDDDKLTFIILDKDTMQNPNRDNEVFRFTFILLVTRFFSRSNRWPGM